jgi:[CysO sulfur-carrier protein]-S-L-cysteine hydrolase
MVQHAQEELRNECCGLLAGRDAVITHILPAANSAAEPAKSYEIAPAELFASMRRMRAEKLALMGIYHSHPNGSSEPSRRDIDGAYYPEAAYFIVSANARPAAVRAFSIREGCVEELKIQAEQEGG